MRVLRGDRSQRVFADAAQRVANRIAGSELINITNSGHALQLDAAQPIADSAAAIIRTT